MLRFESLQSSGAEVASQEAPYGCLMGLGLMDRVHPCTLHTVLQKLPSASLQ